MVSMEPVIDILTSSLEDIAWKLVGTMIVVTILAMIYKTIEKKLLSLVDKKAYEVKAKKEQKKYESLEKKNRQKNVVQPQTPETDSDGRVFEAQHGAWSPTGWVYDRDTHKWDPPEYLSDESRLKWEWDPEKKIWIDLDKKRRVERYHQYRREAGKEPTFEEWKAQRKNDTQT